MGRGNHITRAEEVESLEVNDLKVMMKCPNIPVGGRLTHFIKEWEQITQDQWVLSTIKEGYKLEFNQIPPFLGVKITHASAKNLEVLTKEINSLLEKNAIEIVPKQQTQTGFYSTLFVVPKKNGELRPVINLRPLNQYIRKQHFKMDTMSKVINLVKKGDWGISLDLKDAYLHIPIFQKHRKYLRFCVNGVVYQFRCLCFGPTSAPRVFTKLVSVVAAHLRQHSIRLAIYLDDWFGLNQEKIGMIKEREIILNRLMDLGFIINVEKSSLVPKQQITYIGGLFKLDQGLVLPTPERVAKLQETVRCLMNGLPTAQQYMKLLGIIASCLELIPNARLFMRPIQLHLLQAWNPAKMSLNYQIPCTKELKSHLQWWLNTANITKGRCFQPIQTTITVTTDASMKGWGGHVENQVVQGLWTETDKQNHINNLELEAVFRTVNHFLPLLKNKQVLIRSDNTTVVQYINKQGGTHSLQLCKKTWDLWMLALENRMFLLAAHLAGINNVLADQLSRVSIKMTEWSLKNAVVQQIFHLWGQPMIDLFATVHNRKTMLFCSWVYHPKAFAVDALSISWENMFAYVFPPICLLPRVLQHIQRCQCEIILIAPLWPRQNWFPDLLQMLVEVPIKLPVTSDILTQGNMNISHANPQMLNLTAWRLSTNISKQRVFQNTLEDCWQPHGDQGHKRITRVNSEFSIVGAVNGKLIPIKHL